MGFRLNRVPPTEEELLKEIDSLKLSELGEIKGGVLYVKEGMKTFYVDYLEYFAQEVTKVVFPSTLESVENVKFNHCYHHYEDLELTDKFVLECLDFTACNQSYTIGLSAFEYFLKLREIILGEQTVCIERAAFAGCSNLRKIDNMGYITYLGSGAFSGCCDLEEVVLGPELTSVGDNAFTHCKALRKVSIGPDVTHIEQYAFDECTNLREVKLGDSLKHIETNAFLGCYNLKKLTVGPELEALDGLDNCLGDSGCHLEVLNLHYGVRCKLFSKVICEELDWDYKKAIDNKTPVLTVEFLGETWTWDAFKKDFDIGSGFYADCTEHLSSAYYQASMDYGLANMTEEEINALNDEEEMLEGLDEEELNAIYADIFETSNDDEY